ncbi:hypothetical protein Ahy_A06g028433 [Arachis hypogaea]|uniref:Uncharacterized protein n=1 Tax=Arachis hypogaea TaxID=3818 RepID=A0A445CQZ3_ARAHY|nr:hypothetical protein Ahy_A06g028433 [Arachis hypogaea]
MASSSSKRRKGKEPMEQPPFEEKKFRTFHHAIQFGWMDEKEIIYELGFQVTKTECPEITEKVKKRRWELLTDPVTRVNATLVREFYANAVRIDSSPNYDQIVEDICIPGADWVRDSHKKPKFIKRGDLTPEAKGWFEIVRRSILPAGNNSEFAEKSDSGGRLGYPSTIFCLCAKAGVVFEDGNPEWIKVGIPITL